MAPLEYHDQQQDKDLVKYLESRLQGEGPDPYPPAVWSGCCIFPVPKMMSQLDEDAFAHRFVEIGPYHYRMNSACYRGGDLMNMRINHASDQEATIKWKYLKSFLQWSQLSLNDCINKLKDWRTDILRCYQEPADEMVTLVRNSDGFLRCILLDACFIIEHLRRFYYLQEQEWESKDPIFSKPWLAKDVARDLALTQNQLPFFLLERLYDCATTLAAESPSFLDMAVRYFGYYYQLNVTAPPIPTGQEVLHFTDLLRMLYLWPPPAVGNVPPLGGAGIMSRVPSATKLQDAGVKLRAGPKTPILEFQLAKGVLIIPCLVLSDRTETVFRNIVAFELSYNPFQAYMTDYLFLLRFPINTPKDVDVLVDRGILINYLNDSTAAVTMINNLCLNLPSSGANCYRSLCDGLNKFYDAHYNEDKVILKKDYFSTKWRTVSTVAAVVLLLLTLTQTICSILSLTS